MDRNVTLAILLAVILIVTADGAVLLYRQHHDGDDGPFPHQASRLWVFGNANEDDYLDECDTAYIQRIIDGTEEKTVLADANRDGAIDAKDIDYVNTIIAAMNDPSINVEVFYYDGYFNVESVHWPVNGIAIGYCSGAYVADVTGLCGKVKLIDGTIKKYWHFMYPTYSELGTFNTEEEPNYEAIINSGVDVFVPGYAVSGVDGVSKEKLEPVGVDVMHISTADNSDVDYPNEYIDRSILMFGFLLQGNMEKTYGYLDWHDNVLKKLKTAASAIAEKDRAAFMMTRSSPAYVTTGLYSVTGYNNTNNIHAEWVGVYAVGQHNTKYLSKNYQNVNIEQMHKILIDGAKNNTVFLMDNEHDGMRGQRSLDKCVGAYMDALKTAEVNVHYLGMAREAGNSPLYVVEMAFYQNMMYPDLESGVDWKNLFDYYFEHLTSYDYRDHVDIDRFFRDYGVVEA